MEVLADVFFPHLAVDLVSGFNVAAAVVVTASV
jgi:hypothetical protein